MGVNATAKKKVFELIQFTKAEGLRGFTKLAL